MKKSHLLGAVWASIFSIISMPSHAMSIADFNGDGIVDESDIVVFLNNWLTQIEQPEHYCIGDINEDGSLDSADLQLLIDQAGLTSDWNILARETSKPN